MIPPVVDEVVADGGDVEEEPPVVGLGTGGVDEGVVTTGGEGMGGAEVGRDKGVEFGLCAGEVDEPAVGGKVADDAPFGVTGFMLQLFTSWKAGAPLLLVVGVRVTVQVCTI